MDGREYHFYGAEEANCAPINPLFREIANPRELYDALSKIWCINTCAPRLRENYAASHKTLGQCSITAFLAQDIFGGEVYGVPLPEGGYHCFNQVGDIIFDLTSEQFEGKKLSYDLLHPQSREGHFAKQEKYHRYIYLKAILSNYKSALARQTLETPRLLLRHMSIDDAEMMFKNWASDPEVTKYVTWDTHTDVEETRGIVAKWVENYDNPATIHFGIVEKSSDELVGSIDVVKYVDNVPEIGYCSAKRCWGKGYMTECASAVRDYLFSLGFKSIIVRAMVENIGSNRVIQKIGGELEKVEEGKKLNGEIVICNHYIISR